MTDLPLIIGISGSLRAHAHSTAILRTAGKLLTGIADFRPLLLGDIPLYNQDLDTDEPPAPVAAMRRLIGDAHGLVIATPEYNYGLPGVLKNALDWASRPYGQSKLTGKPVITVSSSPAFTGGVRALSQLHETLLSNGALLVPRPQTVIGLVMQKVADGELADQETIAFFKAALDDLVSVTMRTSFAD